ncbi:hypothetical protein P43SY_007099 [Pythium insidiosum]|uniref:BZIP domain-containing protein n=1 Tax=Pythium insidiosum TaxID=114742 RepID=A0AAD5LHN7_PYTIN|nr:hypothetical protein P43SY_007099 [Pythium insidiosum]
MIHSTDNSLRHADIDCLSWSVGLLDCELDALHADVYTKNTTTSDDDADDSDDGFSIESDRTKESISCTDSDDDSITQSPRAVDEVDQPDFPSPSSSVVGAMSKQAPVMRVRRKRKRMSAEERRVRHREAQRQFMKRKRARINALRQVIRGLERQAQLAQVMRECEALQFENDQLREACAIRATLAAAEAMQPLQHPPDDDEESEFKALDALWEDLLAVFDHRGVQFELPF